MNPFLDAIHRILIGVLLGVIALAFVLCGNYLGAAVVLVGGAWMMGLFE